MISKDQTSKGNCAENEKRQISNGWKFEHVSETERIEKAEKKKLLKGWNFEYEQPFSLPEWQLYTESKCTHCVLVKDGLQSCVLPKRICQSFRRYGHQTSHNRQKSQITPIEAPKIDIMDINEFIEAVF